jgi:hypothetical protein
MQDLEAKKRKGAMISQFEDQLIQANRKQWQQCDQCIGFGVGEA